MRLRKGAVLRIAAFFSGRNVRISTNYKYAERNVKNHSDDGPVPRPVRLRRPRHAGGGPPRRGAAKRSGRGALLPQPAALRHLPGHRAKRTGGDRGAIRRRTGSRAGRFPNDRYLRGTKREDRRSVRGRLVVAGRQPMESGRGDPRRPDRLCLRQRPDGPREVRAAVAAKVEPLME